MAFWLVFLTAFALALIFTPIAIKIAPKIGAVDVPKDDRRMHTKPVPRFGGLAIFIGTTTALIFTVYGALPMYQKYFAEAYPGAEFIDQLVSKMTGVIVGGVLIYIVGVVDDLKGMPAKVKLLGQLVCGGVAYYFGVRINFVTNHFSALTDHIFFSGAISLIITLIWIAGITNTVNLIDGLDGLFFWYFVDSVFVSCVHGVYTRRLFDSLCDAGSGRRRARLSSIQFSSGKNIYGGWWIAVPRIYAGDAFDSGADEGRDGAGDDRAGARARCADFRHRLCNFKTSCKSQTDNGS